MRTQRSLISKIKRYIKFNRVAKLKRYLKKYRSDIDNLKWPKERTMLHYAAKYGSVDVFRYIMNSHSLWFIEDICGNLPVHLACLKVMKYFAVHDAQSLICAKEVQHGIVRMCITRYPWCLYSRSQYGDTTLTYCQRIEQLFGERTSKPKEATNEILQEADGMNDTFWNEKIASELWEEIASSSPKFTGDDRDENCETYSQWSNRIYNEYHHKRKRTLNSNSYKNLLNESKKSSKLESERERMRQRYESLRKKDLANASIKKSLRLREKYDALLKFDKNSKLRLCDLPFRECDDDAVCLSAMLHGIDSSDVFTYRKELKNLIRFWHPDKFQQRFRDCMDEADREHIVQHVVHISQILNSHSESLKE